MTLSTDLILTMLYLPGGKAFHVGQLDALLDREPGRVPGCALDLYQFVQSYRDELPHLFSLERDAWVAAQREADELITAYEHFGIEILGLYDDRYPIAIRELKNPPPVLFAKGDVSLLNAMGVAIVGTSHPTSFGIRCARRFGQIMAELDVTCVSGFELGCDSAVLEGCVDSHGRVIATLQSPLHDIHPVHNLALADHIVELGGVLISEYAPGIRPARGRVAEHYRIIAGLSRGLILVENDGSAESKFTLQFEHAQGKPIGCLIHPPRYQGSMQAMANQQLIMAEDLAGIEGREDLELFLGLCLNTHVNVRRSTPRPRQLGLIPSL